MSNPGTLYAHWILPITRFADGVKGDTGDFGQEFVERFTGSLESPFNKEYLKEQELEKIYEYVVFQREAPDARYVIAKEKLQEAWAKVQAKG